MTRPAKVILAAAAAVLALTGAWLLLAGGGALPTEAELTVLQAKADAACACERRRGHGPGSAACWADFEGSVARYEHFNSSTACMAASTTSVCFGPFDGHFRSCVLKHRPYGACSAKEALARARASREDGCG